MDNSPVLILGSGRSGTTWILDSLAEANNLGTVFEPLFSVAVPEAEAFCNRYIAGNADEPELKILLGKILSAQINNVWTKYRVRPDRIKPSFDHFKSWEKIHSQYYYYKKLCRHYRRFGKNKSSRIIVKAIRANLMIEWILKNFDVKVLLVVRHPAAVICSKMSIKRKARRLNWDPKPVLKKFENDKLLNEQYFLKYKNVFSKPLSTVEGYAIIWCIENILPVLIAKKPGSGACIAYYEDLLINPEKEWKRITKFLNFVRQPSTEILVKPSHEASESMEKEKFMKNQVVKWERLLDKTQIKEIQEVLNSFNVNLYNVHEAMPINSCKNTV